MAFYKASLPVIAKRTEGDTDVTFSGGEYLGKLISVSTAPTTYDVKLYGDDNVAERAKGVSEVALTINTTTFPLSMVKTLFGGKFTEKTESEGAHAEKASADNAEYVAFGFCYSEMIGGDEKAFVKFYPKVKFAVPSESFTTQGETITFGTPTLNATAENDALKGFYEQTYQFDSAADAVTKLKTLTGITTA